MLSSVLGLWLEGLPLREEASDMVASHRWDAAKERRGRPGEHLVEALELLPRRLPLPGEMAGCWS